MLKCSNTQHPIYGIYMTQFVIDGKEYDIEGLGDEAMTYASRMTEIQAENDQIRVRENENLALLNFYAQAIQAIAEPESKIEIVR